MREHTVRRAVLIEGHVVIMAPKLNGPEFDLKSTEKIGTGGEGENKKSQFFSWHARIALAPRALHRPL